MRQLNIKNISLIIVLAGLILFISNCKKDDEHETIPYVLVDLTLDINSTMYLELNSVGGWIYLTGGYKGILVYRLSDDEFVAYERACPYDPKHKNSRIEMEPSGLIATDSVCGSRFTIIDGSVYAGPSTLPLKQFRTTYDGNYLRIFN